MIDLAELGEVFAFVDFFFEDGDDDGTKDIFSDIPPPIPSPR